MGKHRIKCMACKSQKEFHPDRRYYRVPQDIIRKEQWLRAVNRTDLLNIKFSADLRVCEMHFDKKDVPEASRRVKQNAVPFLVGGEIKDTENDTRKIFPSIPMKIEVKEEIEIGPEIMQEVDVPTAAKQGLETKEQCPQDCAVPSYNPYKSTVIDIEELRKLREECANLRKQIGHCNTNEFFIERGKSILPPQLAQMVENHLMHPGSVLPIYMSPAKVTVLCGGFSKKV